MTNERETIGRKRANHEKRLSDFGGMTRAQAAMYLFDLARLDSKAACEMLEALYG